MKTLYHRTEREVYGHHARATMPQFRFQVGGLVLPVLLIAFVLLALHAPGASATPHGFGDPSMLALAAVGATTDTSMVALTKTIDAIGRSFEAYKNTNDERLEALANGDESRAAELNQTLAKIEKDVSAFSARKVEMEKEIVAQRERLEELEARASTPRVSALDVKRDEYKNTFVNWMRSRGQSPNLEQQLETQYKELIVRGDVTVGTGAAGGFAVPKVISSEIERLEKRFSPVRDLVRVINVGTSDYRALVNVRQSPLSSALSGWVGETGSRPATVTPQLREVVPTAGELYAYPQASEWSLDDLFFNVEEWLAEEVAQEFALQEGLAVISGNGTSKPTGMTNSAPTSVADFASPIRAAAVYQFVASAASPDAILPDSLLTLVYTLASQYRQNATFAFNSATAGAIRKLKDTTNQYLWQPGLALGEPERLLGYRTAVWEQMPDVGANTLPVAFGDFRRGYLLVQRTEMRMTRDNVTNIGFVRFYIRRREGGIPWNNDAIKFLKTT
jgi:HK97 family phage major capsid protein